MLTEDTRTEARAAQIRIYRRLGGPRRVAQALHLSEQARTIALAGIRQRDPSLTAEEARRMLLRRILGSELYDRAYARSK